MDKIMNDSILYGTTEINYDIEFEHRRALVICVNPDLTVLLKAPYSATIEQLRQKVHKRANWILRTKRYFESFGTPATERKYISGESHLYLGRQYMLRVHESTANAVHYQNNILEIECRNKQEAGAVLQKWYRQRAEIKFAKYARPIVEQFLSFGVKPREITVRKMDKRWGYCTAGGRIYLNPRLICASRCCIEYVITHEMCHLIHRNHNKDFYSLLAKVMPHWEKWKTKLEKMMV